jgi:hypothetical protein
MWKDVISYLAEVELLHGDLWLVLSCSDSRQSDELVIIGAPID